MQRTILHVDLNNYYASVECLYNPALRDKPIAVCGDVEARHGIVLAKNYPAKALGIKTGEAIWQAKQKASGLVIVPPDFKKYLRFSRLARAIYADYTDQIEPFGIDEAWLDLTASGALFGRGEVVADKIRGRMKAELGLSASIGVSYNKIFAKLGSDMKKPDATTVITSDNFKETVWPLAVSDLLCVGKATRRKLNSRAVYTIGDLARRNPADLRLLLGVWGETLWAFANGYDTSAVRKYGMESVVKSIGNSTTTIRDLQNEDDVKMIVYVLADSVAARLREQGLQCAGVAISVRSNDLVSFERQARLNQPTFLSGDIAEQAMRLFRHNYRWHQPIRSIGVRGIQLVTADRCEQLDLFDADRGEQLTKVAFAVDDIRRRFGASIICRASLLADRKLTGFNPKDDHIIHPTSFLNGGAV